MQYEEYKSRMEAQGRKPVEIEHYAAKVEAGYSPQSRPRTARNEEEGVAMGDTSEISVGQPEPKPFLARIWPIIEVPRCDAIPADYPGPMGVPVSFFDKIGNRNDGSSGFLVIGATRPKLRGKDTYQRLVVVNLKYCDDRFQIYKKPDGTYCTAETPKGSPATAPATATAPVGLSGRRRPASSAKGLRRARRPRRRKGPPPGLYRKTPPGRRRPAAKAG